MAIIYLLPRKYSKLSKLNKIYFRDEILSFNATYDGKSGEITIKPF
jgi:hypothetical protein